MAVEVLTDAKVWLAEFDISGKLNAVSLQYGAEMVDDTVFGDDTRSRAGGLKTVALGVEGYFDGADVDPALFGEIGVADNPVTVAHVSTIGNIAYLFKSIAGDYSPGGQVGDMFAFSAGAEATGGLIRGTLMVNAAAVAATANGTGRQLGAVGATQSLYAALHVTAASGTTPTLDAVVESDDNSGFTTATTRITFTQATAVTSQWATPVAGAITDDWWRIQYTIGGTTPSFDFAVAIGIQ